MGIGRHFNHLTALIRAGEAEGAFLWRRKPSAPIYPRRAAAADCCAADSIHVSDATTHYFSFMMLSNINRAEGCEKGKKPAARRWWAKIMQHHQHRSSPGMEQRIEVRPWSKRPAPQANGFLILSRECVRPCTTHTLCPEWRQARDGKTAAFCRRAACLRMQNFCVYLAGNFTQHARSLIVL